MFYAILQFPSQPTPPPSPCYVERLYVSGALGNGKEESGVWAMKMESQLLRKNNWDTNPFPQNQPKKIAFERESHFVSMHAVLLETIPLIENWTPHTGKVNMAFASTFSTKKSFSAIISIPKTLVLKVTNI